MTQLQKRENPPVVEGVIKRVNQLQEYGELRLPKDYAAENAVRAAWLVLQEQKNRDNKLVLDLATRESIANALFNMVIQGLSVVKKQGDFILYGNKLTFQREYHGSKALAKRLGGVKEVNHVTIYEDDVFEYIIKPDGRKEITKHEQKIQNIDMDKIMGAYAIVTFQDGTTDAEVMTLKQIKQSWMQGATKGQSPAHKNFPDAMAEKTVANRILTQIINASSDAAIFSDDDRQERSKQDELKDKSTPKTISFEDAEEVPDVPEKEPEQEKPEESPEPSKKSTKKDNKADTPKAEKKAAEQPQMEFDDEDNSDEPF